MSLQASSTRCQRQFQPFVRTQSIATDDEVKVASLLILRLRCTKQPRKQTWPVQISYRADVSVLDFNRLHLHAPQTVYDLPSGGHRIIQRAEGYDATIVRGEIVYADGAATGALPGRLVRGPQSLG